MTKTKQWDEHDRLRLTRDCELGKEGETLFVLAVDGPYMSARVESDPSRVVRTGRDYAYATKIGEGIPPGAYELDRDVPNPRSDGRFTRDWRKSYVWKKGTRFVVRECHRDGAAAIARLGGLTPDQIERIRAADVYTVVKLAGDRWATNHRVGPGDQEQYAALAAALVPSEESLSQFMTRIGCESGFVEWLVEHGHVLRGDIELWWHRYQYGEEGDVDPPAVVTVVVPTIV